jgi:hypothetical protein
MPGNHVLLETISLTQAATSVTFDNLPSTGYTDLKIVFAGIGNTTEGTYIAFNGSQANFSGVYLIGDGTSAASGVLTRYIGSIQNQTVIPQNGEIYIPNYTSSSNKSFSVTEVQPATGSAGYQNLISGLWSNTAAITSITLDAPAGYKVNSTFSLYGVAATGTTPTVAPKATGGNIVANDGTYWYHTFLSSGTFIPQTGLNAQILVAGGGGGGGGNIGAGGGAGAMTTFSSTSSLVSGTVYTCTVGGAAPGGSGSANGTQGNTSSFLGSGFTAISALGGGKGPQSGAGFAGGSGSGAAPGGSPAGTASGPNTNDGGSSYYSYPYYAAGGGGGAVSVGGNGQTGTATGGNGGTGFSTTSLGVNTLTEFSGMSFICAGGAGSGVRPDGGGSTGGTSNGGGNGGFSSTNATSATSFGSGGGGGTWTNYASGNGGNGYQGVVVIRYLMAS